MARTTRSRNSKTRSSSRHSRDEDREEKSSRRSSREKRARRSSSSTRSGSRAASKSTSRSSSRSSKRPAKATSSGRRSSRDRDERHVKKGAARHKAKAAPIKTKKKIKITDPANLLYSVKVCGRSLIEIKGHLVSYDENTVIVRHRKERSSKMLVQSFAMKDIVSIEGNEGEAAVIMAYVDVVVKAIDGRISHLDGGFIEVITADGDSVTLNRNNSAGLEIHVSALEDDIADDIPVKKGKAAVAEDDDEEADDEDESDEGDEDSEDESDDDDDDGEDSDDDDDDAEADDGEADEDDEDSEDDDDDESDDDDDDEADEDSDDEDDEDSDDEDDDAEDDEDEADDETDDEEEDD